MLVIRAKAMRLLWLIGFLIDVVHSTSCGSTSKLLGNSPRLSTKSDEKMMIYNPESELMLGVVIPVTDKSVASDQCVARDAGLQTVEAILYTLDIVNKDLPFTLGAVVLDTCYATELAVENTVKLILPTEVDRDVNIRYRCSNDTPAIVNENRAAFWKVVGIIGSVTSAESLQMTYILEMGRSPQVRASFWILKELDLIPLRVFCFRLVTCQVLLNCRTFTTILPSCGLCLPTTT